MNLEQGDRKQTRDTVCYMRMNDNIVPMPELLTEDEAIQFLRLDVDGPKDPSLSLRYYREHGLLKGTKVGKRIRYRKQELIRFLDILDTQDNSRKSA